MSHLFLEYFALLSSKDHEEFLKENGGLTQNFNGRTTNPIHFLEKKEKKNQTCIKVKLHKKSYDVFIEFYISGRTKYDSEEKFALNLKFTLLTKIRKFIFLYFTIIGLGKFFEILWLSFFKMETFLKQVVLNYEVPIILSSFKIHHLPSTFE